MSIKNVVIPIENKPINMHVNLFIRDTNIFLGERYVYKFVCDPDALFNMAYGTQTENHCKLSTGNLQENWTHKSEIQNLVKPKNLNCYNCEIPTSCSYLQENNHALYI